MKSLFLLIAFAALYGFQNAFAINPLDTRMLSQPAISDNHIAFIYAEDLWIAQSDGSNPRRLTIDEGVESNPVFSPDGKLIAFSAEYDGNTDVFTVPVTGGVPKRLTWHPGSDYARDFTPDGKSVLFLSQRSVFTNRHARLYTVPVEGGYPIELPIPSAYYAAYAADGKHIAYTPLSPAFQQWKHYRGGRISRIWIYNVADHGTVEIPQPNGGCNDINPMWSGNNIYFLSDRSGEFNLYLYEASTKNIKQVTTYSDFPIVSANMQGGKLIFEQAGYLHKIENNGSAQKIKVGIATDLLEMRPRYVKGAKYIRSGDISPSGARAVFDFRGEIITVPAEKGDPRNLTETTNVHEKYPAWSPDGKSIADFSDASGEDALHIIPQDGKTKPRSISLNGAGFYANIHWSPDSKKLCFVDNSRTLYILDIASGTAKKVDSDEMYFPGVFRDLFGDWSKDSKWIAYNKVLESNYRQVFVYSVEQGKSYPISDGLSDANEIVFDSEGKYLFFFASTDAGPVVNWFDQSNNDMRSVNSIYLVTLQKETISPFAKESDEEEITEPGKEEEKPVDSKKGKKVSTPPEVPSEIIKIDFEGISKRIVDVPIIAKNYNQLVAGKDNDIYYVEQREGTSNMLYKYDIKEKKESEVMELDNYVFSADKKKMLYAKGQTYGITDAGKKPEAGKGILAINAVEVKIDPPAEWVNTFNEAWRINRDYFYDPGMHGADWPAMKKKYEPFLSDLSCRSDLNRLIQWMCSELVVGHHRLAGQGDQLGNPDRVGGGLLGVDYAINNNRYQFKKIYGGLNWNPELRSPLTEPGINAKEGEYLLAVNGKEVTAPTNVYSYFENTDGKIVELTIGPNPSLTGSRVVKVVPVGSEYSLRNRDWVEGNLKKVTAATNGQVAYVYVPNTAGLGHTYFKRYFYPQANRNAIIVDERFNGGGQLADYYIDILLRPYQAHWNFRYGKDLKSPSASIQGPKVMITDETAGSGGDMLPWMFRKFKVGTIVGKRTWGGLVGVLGFPEFIDGASVTAPNVGIWTEDGFIVENVGVAPDIEVEQTPKDVIEGHDPQLEKAIEVALDELKKNPPVEPVRPPYPVKVKY